MRTIVALDLPDAEAALAMALRVRDHVVGFKIGLGLLHGPGPVLIEQLNAMDRPVFADGKLHDIPSQVATAARQLGRHDARWVTVHASGGVDMMRAAVAGLKEGNPDGGVLAVTVLTSLDWERLAVVGIDEAPAALAATMSMAAAEAGCEGIVCSPHELAVVGTAAPGLLRVTPGIRPDPGHDDDQARTATPAEAIAAGADLLVVGRPITAADDPARAAAMINKAAPAS